MDQNQQELFELLENLRQITLVMKDEVEAGKWEKFPLHVQERQELMEKLGTPWRRSQEERQKIYPFLETRVAFKWKDVGRIKNLVNRDLMEFREK